MIKERGHMRIGETTWSTHNVEFKIKIRLCYTLCKLKLKLPEWSFFGNPGFTNSNSYHHSTTFLLQYIQFSLVKINLQHHVYSWMEWCKKSATLVKGISWHLILPKLQSRLLGELPGNINALQSQGCWNYQLCLM